MAADPADVTVEVTSEVGKALLEEGIEPRDAAPLAAALEASGKETPEAAMAALEPILTASSHVGRSDMLVIIARCPELMEQQPEQLEQRLQALLDLTHATPQQVVHLLLKASYLLQHDPESIKSKVMALQEAIALPESQVNRLQILDRICRFPVLIEQTVDELYHQMQGLANLLGVELTAAVRQAYKVPALAAQKPEDLDARMDTLSELLHLDRPAIKAMALKQPSILSRATEGLQSKVAAYQALLGGPEAAAQVLAAVPQLLTMSVDSVSSRKTLLEELVQLQPSWQEQLEQGGPELLAMCLVGSEKKLRRLETAVEVPDLARLPLGRILSFSESRWAAERELAENGGAAASRPAGEGGRGGGAPREGGQEGAKEGYGKPKRPRGGRRERERLARIAARQAAAEEGGEAAPPAPAAAAQGEGGAGSGKPRHARGGRRERERKARIAARLAAAGGDVPATDQGAGGGGGSGAGGSQGSQQQGSEDATRASDKPKRPRGGRREREKRERREARAAAAAAAGEGEAGFGEDAGLAAHQQDFGAGFGAGGAPAEANGGGSYDADDGDDGPDGRARRASRGGRREREKRERLASKQAAGTAAAVASGVLDA